MNCPFCEATLPDGATFCAQCGKSLTEEPTPAPAPAPAKKAKAAKKKRSPILRFVCGFFSTLLLIVALLLGITLGSVLMLQNVTSPDTIRAMVDELDFAQMELTVDGESKTVSATVHEAFADAQAENGTSDDNISPEQVDKLLEADFFKDYLAQTTSDVASDLINGTDNAKTDADGFREFLVDNRAEIEEILEVELTDEMIDGIAADVEESQVMETLSVSGISDSAPFISDVLQLITSTVTWILFGTLVFILAIIALINWFRPISLTYAGIVFLLSGGVYGALAMVIKSMAGSLSDLLDIPEGIMNFLTGGIVSAATDVFLTGATIGLLLIAGAITYTVLRSHMRKKAG